MSDSTDHPGRLRRYTSTEFQQLVRGMVPDGEVLVNDRRLVVKTLRKRRWHRGSPAESFARNALDLHDRGIPTVQVEGLYQCPDTGRHCVIYAYLPGQSLRARFIRPDEDLVARLARFMARLHERGVYFRGLHLGNVLRCEDGRLALLDVSSIMLLPQDLGVWRRIRNFKPLLRYSGDVAALKGYGLKRFLGDYLEAARLSRTRRWVVERALARRLT